MTLPFAILLALAPAASLVAGLAIGYRLGRGKPPLPTWTNLKALVSPSPEPTPPAEKKPAITF